MVGVGQIFKHYPCISNFTRFEGTTDQNRALEVFNDKSIPLTFMIEASMMTQMDNNDRALRGRFTRTRKMSLSEEHTTGDPATDYDEATSERVWGRASRVYQHDGNSKSDSEANNFEVSEVVTLNPQEKIYFRWLGTGTSNCFAGSGSFYRVTRIA